MKDEDIENNIDYKNLYYDIKEKYEKILIELEELKIDIKLKEEEITLLRKKLNSNSNDIRINYNSLENKDSSFFKGEDNNNNNLFNDNSIYKQTEKKYDNYSVDSFRNDVEQGKDLLQELMKSEMDEIKLEKIKNMMEIENNNFQILSNKTMSDKANNINRTLTGDIDAILLNIKIKQESLHQTQKMFNLKNDK